MLDNEHIPTCEEAIEYFKCRGCNEAYATKWWNRQQQFKWVSRFPIRESADRWIANATEDERLPPEKRWMPFGRTEAEQRICAQDALLRERSAPGTYTASQLRDIHAFLNTSSRR